MSQETAQPASQEVETDPRRAMLIDDVVEREWQFFTTVNNQGGAAACQSMPNTFNVARRAQYATWSTDAIASWDNDLAGYENRGANPCTFKYGFMMRTTHPDEYARIKDMLPEVTPDQVALVQKLVDIETSWAEELAQKYPHYAGKSRPIYSTGDSAEWTSTETYARSEFSTYSLRTLELVLASYRDAVARGENLTETTATAQARAFGYETLAACDQAIAEGRMSGQGLDGKVQSCG